MTVLDANLTPDIRSGPPRFASTLADLMRMSWPIMLCWISCFPSSITGICHNGPQCGVNPIRQQKITTSGACSISV